MARTFLYLLLFITCAAQAQKATLSGIIYDAESGETLVGATIYLNNESKRGTVSNVNGLFSFPGLPREKISVSISFIGFKTQIKNIDLAKKSTAFIEVNLKPANNEIAQINIIEAAADIIGDREIETSQHRLSPQSIRNIPTARNDVFKAMRFMPGIEATEPLSPLVSVRGSDPGENLIMLDGVTIYNPYHFISSSGIFNMSTVKNIDMMVGGFGAEYGGRNSSVIHISTKDGTKDGVHGEVTPSTVESSVFVELPLGKKTTMMMGGRLNYDIIGNFIMGSDNYFYDMNASITHRFNAKNRLTLKYFRSHDHTDFNLNDFYKQMGNTFDRFGVDEVGEILSGMNINYINQWNNNIATAIYKSVITPKLFFRTQIYASLHSADNGSQFKMEFDDMAFNTSTHFKSKVQDYTAKAQFDYRPYYGNQLKVGVEYSSYLFENASTINTIKGPEAQSKPDQWALYAEDKIKIGPVILRPGIRITEFNNQNYTFEPRLNAAVSFAKGWKAKGAYGKYYQNIISMNTQELEFNQFLDYYYPLSKVAPSLSYHYIVGLEKKIGKSQLLSADIYYKDIARTYTFDFLQNRYEAFALSDKIFAGNGETYGIELLWKGQIEKWSGWASYTYAESNRSFPNIMKGKRYEYDYNHHHTFKGVLNYQASKRISYSTDFMFQSGVPRSVENSLQMFYMYEPISGEMIYSPQYTIDQKNSSRMPWIINLNMGVQKQIVRGFGKDISDFFNADESYFTVNIRNLTFFRRNVAYYIPIMGYEQYFPMGLNYLPTVSYSYTIKF